MFYIDDYAIVDCHYLVHAIPIDPGPDDAADDWLIATVLHVASQAIPAYQRYPTRALRDVAFEQLCTLMRRLARLRAEEFEGLEHELEDE